MKKTVAIILAAASLAACAPVFSGCNCSGKVKFTLSEEGGRHYIISFSGLSSPGGEYVIPETYGNENIPVTEIAAEGFSGTRFSKITVPETVTKIGNMAFSYCHALKEVEFAEGIKLESFNRALFAHSENLQQITIPDSVKTIGAYAFSNCYGLSTVEMSAVESIGYSAFEECDVLERISLPSTLTTIGELAFYRAGLKEIEIPGSVTDKITVDGEDNESTVAGFGLAAFLGCTSLESVKIDEGVKIIPSAAFGACTALKEVHIPLSVEEIQGAHLEGNSLVYGDAFYGCTALVNVYFAGSEEEWMDIKIENSFYSSSVNNDPIKNARINYESK